MPAPSPTTAEQLAGTANRLAAQFPFSTVQFPSELTAKLTAITGVVVWLELSRSGKTMKVIIGDHTRIFTATEPLVLVAVDAWIREQVAEKENKRAGEGRLKTYQHNSVLAADVRDSELFQALIDMPEHDFYLDVPVVDHGKVRLSARINLTVEPEALTEVLKTLHTLLTQPHLRKKDEP